MRVELNSDGYLLGQQISIEDLLQQHGLADANGVCVPIGEECNEAEVLPPQLLLKSSTGGESQFGASSHWWAACCGTRAARGRTPTSPYKRKQHDKRTSRPRTTGSSRNDRSIPEGDKES